MAEVLNARSNAHILHVQCSLIVVQGEKKRIVPSPNYHCKHICKFKRPMPINGKNFRFMMLYLSSSSAANKSELVGTALKASLDLC